MPCDVAPARPRAAIAGRAPVDRAPVIARNTPAPAAVYRSVRDLTAPPARWGYLPCCTAQESEHARGDRGFALLCRPAGALQPPVAAASTRGRVADDCGPGGAVARRAAGRRCDGGLTAACRAA